MKLKIIIGIILGFMIQSVFAQKGELTGNIKDKEFNDVLPFANVTIKGTSIGTTSDFEGNYSLTMGPGEYTVVFSFIGYETLEISEVKI